MDSLPLVTIGAVNYNHSRFIIEALDSIKQQTYPNIQLIIVDDFSTDNSVSLINEWLKTYDKPVQFIAHPKNMGAISGVNDVLQNATGKYLSMIATDDAFMPDKIRSQVEMFAQQTGNVGMIYGDSVMIDETGNIVYPSMFEHYHGKNFNPPSGHIFKEILKDFYFFWQASLIDLAMFKKINFTFDAKVIADDWDLELAMSRNYEVYGYKTIQAKYRRVNTGITLTNWVPDKMDKVRKSQFLMIKKYYHHHLNTSDDKRAIVKKLKRLYWEIYYHKNTLYKEKVSLYWQIFTCSRSMKDLVLVILLLLKIEKIRKPFVQLANG